MGLRLRGDAWYLRKNVGGKRQEVPLGVYGGEKNWKRANKVAKDIAAQLTETHAAVRVMRKAGIEPPKKVDDSLTVAGWWDQYKQTYEPLKAEKTQATDARIMRYWTPILGHLKLTEVRAMHCQAGLNLRRQALAANPKRKNPTVISEGTVQRERRFLRALFAKAVDNGLLDTNPWRGIKGVADKTRADRVLSVEDEVKLREALTAARPDATGALVTMHPRYLRFVEFLLETGLRLDELLNDQFRDLKDRVRVVGKFAKTREVYLTKKARQVLDEQWKDTARPETQKAHPWWQDETRFRAVLRVAAKRAGIPHLSPHDLRHTFGHRYLERGGRMEDLSKILGHAGIAVTEKHYAYRRKEDVGAKMLAVMEAAT